MFLIRSTLYLPLSVATWREIITFATCASLVSRLRNLHLHYRMKRARGRERFTDRNELFGDSDLSPEDDPTHGPLQRRARKERKKVSPHYPSVASAKEVLRRHFGWQIESEIQPARGPHKVPGCQKQHTICKRRADDGRWVKSSACKRSHLQL